MTRLNPVVFVLILVVLCGCTHLKIPFFHTKTDQAETDTLSDANILVANEFVDKGKIINRERLQQQQNLSIYPFRAGVNVEATDDLGKVALMIVKGITDTFSTDRSGKHAHFNILTAESADPADLVIKGRITNLAGPSAIKKWLPMTSQRSLGIAGKLVDAKTGEVIIIFTDSEITRDKYEDYSKLGYRIGMNIGQFILSGID